jgi:nicotinate-nucleotide adenylyltransferase
MRSRRIGILGGTFDPIHGGHLDAARAAESALDLTAIVLIPVNIPPHRPQPVASSHHRFAMVALAIAGRSRWRVSDIELGIGSPSFTTGTLSRIHEQGLLPTELFFIVGADAFAEIESWMEYPAILDQAHFVVISRPGFPVSRIPVRLPALECRMAAGTDVASRPGPSIFLIDAPTADVSSTAIRRSLAEGASIAGLVPAAVQQHIEQHALYSASPLGDFGVDTARTSTAGRLHGQDR